MHRLSNKAVMTFMVFVFSDRLTSARFMVLRCLGLLPLISTTDMPSFKPIIPKQLTNLYARRAHSPGVAVGSFVFVSGMLGRDEDLNIVVEPEAQIVRVFENMGSVLTEAGCDWTDVVELTAYFTNLRRHFDLFVKVRRRLIDEPHPAMTMVGVAELAHPDLICELKGVAVLPIKQQD